jgi:hypothetical protein
LRKQCRRLPSIGIRIANHLCGDDEGSTALVESLGLLWYQK